MTTIISKTKRLFLRRFDVSDVDDLTEVLGHPEVMEFSLSGPVGRAAVSQQIQ